MDEVVYSEPFMWVLAAFVVVLFVLLSFIIALWIKVNKLRKKYIAMMNGGSVHNLEDLLVQLSAKLEHANQEAKQQNSRITAIESAMRKMKSKIGVLRYNAFGERGSDLSFTVAIVDEERDGVVITGIHNRESMYIYAKPLDKGQSAYALTPEELEAINRSSGK